MVRALVIIAVLFSSCYSPRYVYSPSTQNIPVLNKKGDVELAGYFASGIGGHRSGSSPAYEYNKGIDLHGAYAITDHFAVMVNKYNRWERNSGDNNFFYGDSLIIKYNRGLIETGVGYYTPCKGGNSFFQLFGGLAFGKFSITERDINNAPSFNRFHKSNILKLFIQPAIIIGQKKNFTAKFSSRISSVFYNNIKTNYTSSELDQYFLANLSGSPIFFWEPAMDYTFGFKKIKSLKFNFQLGLSFLGNKKFVDSRTFNLAFGISSDMKWLSGKKPAAKPVKSGIQ